MIRALGLLVILLVASCSGGDSQGGFVIDRAPASTGQAVPLTLEEAGLLASGALIGIYGLDADPVPTRVDGTEGRLGDQRVWRLGLTVAVTVDGARAKYGWTMWVWPPAEGPPAVLRAERSDE